MPALRRSQAALGTAVGIARVDRRTKDLIKRLQPGDVAVIDHEDLDRVAAEGLVEANVGAVVNASASISGRYPTVGPLLVAAAGAEIRAWCQVDPATRPTSRPPGVREPRRTLMPR